MKTFILVMCGKVGAQGLLFTKVSPGSVCNVGRLLVIVVESSTAVVPSKVLSRARNIAKMIVNDFYL